MSSSSSASKSSLTLYSLQASRSIRIAWLLEELHVSYENRTYERQTSRLSPPEYRVDSGSSFGKAPVLRDRETGRSLVESGAITQYILSKHDENDVFAGKPDSKEREQINMFIHAAEGTFMLHALAVLYLRKTFPVESDSSTSPDNSEILKTMEQRLANNVWRDMDFLEESLASNEKDLAHAKSDGEAGERGSKDEEDEGEGGYLVGNNCTAADTMMLFGILFVFKNDLAVGRGIGEWKRIEEWVERCVAREGWRKAVEKTGFVL